MIATFAAAGGTIAGVAALATSGVAGFLTVAGGVLSAVGGLTGNKKLTKVGGIMGLAGGLASAFNSANAASSAGSAGGDFGYADPSAVASGAEAAQLGQYATPVGQELGQVATTSPADSMLGGDFGYADPSATATGSSWSTSVPTDPVVQRGMLGDNLKQIGAGPGPTNAVGSGTNQLGDAVNQLGRHVKANKELYQLGGGMLQGMFGPQAEALDLERRELERRRRNLNHIVRVG